MNTAKDEVRNLLNNLPDECTLEDVQYHLYVVEKIKRGTRRGETERSWTTDEVVERLSGWLKN